MLRAHLLDGVSVTAAAAAHGYSRAGFYLVAAAFEQAGMSGLLDDKRGRRGPVKLTAEIVEFLQSAPPARSGAELAARSPTGSGWAAPAHRGTGPSAVSVARALSPGRRFWPAGEAAQAHYEALRAHVMATGAPPDSLAAARFARRGVAGLIAWPAAEPVFAAGLLGAARSPWTPHADPPLDALAAGFALLLGAVGEVGAAPSVVRRDRTVALRPAAR